jgi:SAM-dependent methyltransferase
MISDDRYRAKLGHRGRGLDELERRVGGVVGEIEARLARQAAVRVLELGCGYGTALLELRERYGARVELFGLNHRPGDGNAEILRRNALERGLARAAEALPALAYADVADGLPYARDTFDLVFSQVAWQYFRNKIAVIREVMRVLRADGIARIDAHEQYPKLPAEYARLVEIWEGGRLVPFGDYLRRFGLAPAAAPEGDFVRFGKCAAFGEDLALVLEIDTSTLHAQWDGVKCVYARACTPAGDGGDALSAGGTDTD